MSRTHRIDITDRSDRWRYTCPRGHRSWEPTNHHFWCQQCARSHDGDPTFHELLDRHTQQHLPREDLELVTSGGAHQ